MALLLKHEEVMQTVSMDDAIVAMESGFKEEGEGGALLPQRINVKAGKGWFRVGPVVLQNSGWVGFKAMNLAPGHGLRYQVHLYSIESGELLCIMDAQHLTTLRTGATSAVATRRLKPTKPCVVSLLGSGAEAHAQLDAMRAQDTCPPRARIQPDRGQPQAPRRNLPQNSWHGHCRRRTRRPPSTDPKSCWQRSSRTLPSCWGAGCGPVHRIRSGRHGETSARSTSRHSRAAM
jgi:hypothetical protein